MRVFITEQNGIPDASLQNVTRHGIQFVAGTSSQLDEAGRFGPIVEVLVKPLDGRITMIPLYQSTLWT